MSPISHPAIPSPPRGLLDRAAQGFESRFGTAPAWMAAAPGRVNLIGEHVDYAGGFVMPIAIDRWAVAAAAPASDSGAESVVFAIDFDRSIATADTSSDLAALASVVRRFPIAAETAPPLAMAVTSDVPRGAGLSSSAAVEVALATVLETARGTRLDPRDKALLCQAAEHEAGVPCGIMDVLVAASARAGCAMFIDCTTLETHSVPLPPDLALLVVNTGVRRALADTAYAERRASCARVASVLGVANLRRVDRAMLDGATLTAEDRRRAEHVVDENARTQAAAEALDRGELERCGDLLFASHTSLRDTYEVSCPELDTIVDAARRLRYAGARVFGARMTGAGFGGCAIVACAAEATLEIAQGVVAAFSDAHGRIVDPFVVRAVGAAAPCR